jgi:hypothetical protein
MSVATGHRAGWAAGVVVVVCAALLALVWLVPDRSTTLAGADLLADTRGRSSLGWEIGHEAESDNGLDDLRVARVRVVSARPDDFTLLAEDFSGLGIVRATPSGEILGAWGYYLIADDGGFAMAADGRYASTREATVTQMKVTDGWRQEEVEARFLVGSVTVDMDGSMLVGSASGPSIDSVSLDGATRRLLAPVDDPGAGVVAPDDLGPIVSLVRLPDQRVVFVSDAPDGFRLSVLDGRRVAPFVGDHGENPVRFMGGAPVTYPDPRDPREQILLNGPRLPAMQPLALGPGGKVITIGLGRGDVPEISLVDVDTGEIDVLARLDGVAPSDDEPVSAVAVGDDLVFTASGCVWRLEDAFGRLNRR